MCLPIIPLMAISMAATAAAGAMSAYGQYQQGKTQQQIANNNATVAGYAAKDAQYRGEIAAQNAQRQGNMAEGATRARLSANGVDLGVGTAGDIQASNDFFTETNVANARDNAAREAWSDRTQGANFTAQGNAAAFQGNVGAFSTALSTAGQVAGRWYSYGNPSPYPYMGG